MMMQAAGSSSGFPEGLEDDDDDDDDDHDDHDHDHDHEEHEHHHDHSEEEAKANEGLSEGNHIHLGGEDEHEHEHHHHHHHGLDADDVFDSIGIETINKYTKESIENALKQLPDTIVRAKGIVPSAEGGWLFFDYVPGDTDIREGSPAYTGLITVIGEKVDVELLKKLFEVR